MQWLSVMKVMKKSNISGTWYMNLRIHETKLVISGTYVEYIEIFNHNIISKDYVLVDFDKYPGN